MKRILMMAVLGLALGTAACGGGAATDDATAAPDAADATPEIGAAADSDGTAEAAAADASGEEAAEGTPSASPTPDPTVIALAASFEPPLRGDPDAPILIYEFSDYRCPYCRSFATETMPGLVEHWIDTGRVALVYIDFPLPSHGFPAVQGAELAHCAGEQDRYWEMHDAIYAAFAKLNDVDPEDEAASAEAMRAVAEDSGIPLDMDALDACVASQKYRPIIAALVRQSRDSGVEATPTLLIVNGDYQEGIPGFLPYEDFAQILEREWSRHLGTPIPDPTPVPTSAAGDDAAGAPSPSEEAGDDSAAGDG